jgi:hypothetical protein
MTITTFGSEKRSGKLRLGGFATAIIGGLVVFAGIIPAADLKESYTSLQDAFGKKDVAGIKTQAAETAKGAKEVMAEPQPSDAAQVEAWKGRQTFAKEATEYAEYSLAATAAENPAAAVELTEALIAQNPKSKQLDTAAPYYLAALNKQGVAKANSGAQKILAGDPDQVDALAQLANTNPQYANKLVQVARTKPKPEGMSDADWERRKNQMIQSGTYSAAIAPCARNSWNECDKAMRAAEPVLKGTQMAGTVYFYLGVANFQMGTLTADKSKEKIGLDFTKQAAGIAGPMQGQAANNVAAMAKTLATPGR